MKRISHFSPAVRHGFSLVELMVGMAISMIGIVIMFHVYSSFESQKRRSSSGGEIQQGAAMGMMLIARETRDAGFGLNDPLVIGCPTYVFRVGSANPQLITFSPVVITDGGVAGSDSITFVRGGDVRNETDVDNYTPLSTAQLGQDYAGDASALRVTSTIGFQANNVVLIAKDAQPTRRCSLFEVSGVSGSDLQHAAGAADGTTWMNSSAALITDTGVAMPYSAAAPAAQLFNVGRRPAGSLANFDLLTRYEIQNAQLARTTLLSGTTVPVMDDVVGLQAEYGFDTSGAPAVITVNQWSATMLDADGDGTSGDGGDFQRIGAIRVAVIVRSKEMVDKRQDAALCGTDTAFDAEIGAAADDVARAPIYRRYGLENFWPTPGSLANSGAFNSVLGTIRAARPATGATADVERWTCYRYRTFESVIPTRNIMWSNR